MSTKDQDDYDAFCQLQPATKWNVFKAERDRVLVEVVKICSANGTEQKDMLEVVRSILQRDVKSASAMSLADCIEVRRVLLEEAAYVQEGVDE